MKAETLFKKLKEEVNSLKEVYWIISETELDIRTTIINQYKTKLKNEYNYTNDQVTQFDF